MKLNITSEDIKAGEPARHERDCEDKRVFACPVTLALMRALKDRPCPNGCGQVCVSIGTNIGVGDPYPSKTAAISVDLADWMRRWDAGQKMRPATFEVDL